MKRIKINAIRTALLLTGLLVLAGVVAGPTTASPVAEIVLMPSGGLGPGTCSATESCVEECLRLQNGTIVRQGVFCCLANGYVPPPGMGCPPSMQVVRYKNGPV